MDANRISVIDSSSTTHLVKEDLPLIPKQNGDFCSRWGLRENKKKTNLSFLDIYGDSKTHTEIESICSLWP